MIQQQLRKSGNSYVVTVPKELVERNGWQEGQLLGVEFTPLQVRPVLRPEATRGDRRTMGSQRTRLALFGGSVRRPNGRRNHLSHSRRRHCHP